MNKSTGELIDVIMAIHHFGCLAVDLHQWLEPHQTKPTDGPDVKTTAKTRLTKRQFQTTECKCQRTDAGKTLQPLNWHSAALFIDRRKTDFSTDKMIFIFLTDLI